MKTHARKGSESIKADFTRIKSEGVSKSTIFGLLKNMYFSGMIVAFVFVGFVVMSTTGGSAETGHSGSPETGYSNILSYNDAVAKFQADKDPSVQLHPPFDGPTEEKYYSWTGPLRMKEGDLYITWNVYEMNNLEKAMANITGEPAWGFGFKGIKKKFSPIHQDELIRVCGKYTHNETVTLFSGEKRVIPVLSDCVVDLHRSF